MRQRDKSSGHKWPRKSRICLHYYNAAFQQLWASTSHFVTVTNQPRKQKTTFTAYNKLLIKGSCRVNTDKESLK